MHEHFQPVRQSRSSAVDVTKVIRSRSAQPEPLPSLSWPDLAAVLMFNNSGLASLQIDLLASVTEKFSLYIDSHSASILNINTALVYPKTQSSELVFKDIVEANASTES